MEKFNLKPAPEKSEPDTTTRDFKYLTIAEWRNLTPAARAELEEQVNASNRALAQEQVARWEASPEGKQARADMDKLKAEQREARALAGGEKVSKAKKKKVQVPALDWPGLPPRLCGLYRALDAEGEMAADVLDKKILEQPSRVIGDYKKHPKWGKWIKEFITRPHHGYYSRKS